MRFDGQAFCRSRTDAERSETKSHLRGIEVYEVAGFVHQRTCLPSRHSRPREAADPSCNFDVLRWANSDIGDSHLHVDSSRVLDESGDLHDD